MNHQRITEGSKVLANGHLVTYKQISHVGWFAEVAMTETHYQCECGVRAIISGRHLTSNYSRHDSWLKTDELSSFASNLLAMN